MPSQRILVEGRVQGVGFRAFAHRSAQVLGVKGEVWNRREGGVEMIAAHESVETLAGFERLLKSGPGEIGRIVSQEVPDQEWSGFVIGPSR